MCFLRKCTIEKMETILTATKEQQLWIINASVFILMADKNGLLQIYHYVQWFVCGRFPMYFCLMLMKHFLACSITIVISKKMPLSNTFSLFHHYINHHQHFHVPVQV